MPRLAVAMLSHEGNSFSPVPTTLADFQAAVWCAGPEARLRFAGTESEMGGVLAFLAARPDWDAEFLRVAQATPGGPLAPGVFDAIRAEIVEGLAGGRFDAVYLALHGAMMVEGRDLADLELIARVREAIGPEVPLGVSFDLHANLDPSIAWLVDFASAYKTHPHVDQRDTALRVLDALDRTLVGAIRPVGAIAKAGAILPSINMRTDAGPMAEIEAIAASLVTGPVLEAVPFGGFSYADTAAAGAAAMVFADRDRDAAVRAAGHLRDAIDARRDAFFEPLPGPAEAVARALAVIARGEGPVAVVDAGDNPLSGGIADTPGLLRALIDAAPPVPSLMIYFCDPELVGWAEAAGAGGRLEGTLGARLSDRFGAAVPFAATVVALAPGAFAARPPLICGPGIDFGRLALIRLDGAGGGIHVVLATRAASPHDPGLLTALGIGQADFPLVGIKAKNHFRAAYAGRFGAILACDAPGPAALDIAAFPFERAPGHLYPLGGGGGA
ncbi:M81 family metallopeptidase [Sphingomonas canadensis]|uniref:Microcystinase C n=1 Tax=Sphingomonas canadensis TaxID=1219257 RepID=A0ABW3H6T4_9SPHN|nr:M81 family metallopeptidase [Sphingomonas canadensis]MCW3836222.1 M81 family metallopeptidase [Sphingomonas canadensis]